MRLLVVDDIPTIADGVAAALGDLDAELAGEPIERLVAYSGEDALTVLEGSPVDIVVSDIRMPSVSGLDLLREIRDRWPDCRVVFLSGFDEFSYAQQALRMGAAGYVLKVEGDEQLLVTVRGIIADLRGKRERELLRSRVEARIAEARPIVRDEYLRRLVAIGGESAGSRVRAFSELGIKLNAAAPVCLAAGRIDSAGEVAMPLSRSHKVRYAIASLLDTATSADLSATAVDAGEDRFFILIQIASEPADADKATVAILEQLQARLAEASAIHVSLAVARVPVSWEQVPAEAERLRRELGSPLGVFSGALIVAGAEDAEKPDNPTAEPIRGETVESLRFCLETGDVDRFARTAGPLLASMQSPDRAIDYRLACYYVICSALLGHIARNGLKQALAEDTSVLYKGPGPDELSAAAERLTRLSRDVLRVGRTAAEDSRRSVVRSVRDYVDRHVDTASLTTVAEHVGLNPSYLSRLYKDATDEALSAYIADRRLELAMRLLATTNLYVQAIAAEVGYQSPISFDRFFKARLGITPQQYRDAQTASAPESSE